MSWVCGPLRRLASALLLSLLAAAPVGPAVAQSPAEPAPAADGAEPETATETEAEAGPVDPADIAPPPPVLEVAPPFVFWERRAARAEELATGRQPDPKLLTRSRETMLDQRAAARAAAERFRAALPPLREQLDALGPRPEVEGALEEPGVAASRATIEAQIAQVDGALRQAELAATRAGALAETIAATQRAIFTAQLLTRGESVSDPAVWSGAARDLGRVAEGVSAYFSAIAANADPFGAQVASIALLILVSAFAVASRRALRAGDRRLRAALGRAEEGTARVWLATALFVSRAAPPILLALAYFAILQFGDVLVGAGDVFVWLLVETVIAVAGARSLARLYFAPFSPDQRLVELSDADARRAVDHVTALAAVVMLSRAALDALVVFESGVDLPSLINTASALVCGPLIWLVGSRLTHPRAASAAAAGDAPAEGDETELGAMDPVTGALSTARLAVAAAALVGPAAAILGYHAMSRFLIESASATIGVLAAAVAVYMLAARLSGALSDASAPAPGAAPAPQSLAPIFVAIALTILLTPVLAYIWGASTADLMDVGRTLIDGVEIGETRFSAADVLAVIIVLIIGLWVTRFLQRLLRRVVLPRTRLDTGLRSSITSGVGYLGFFVTALVAVSSVGLDLSNLAIVAGALSVGVGFGLQNIVNNFVSGIILLVERPIKVGDWIVVGADQGYVRKINVRSTEIETFDRSSVIVPNSTLISGTVTNWTHKNLIGRVIVPVGVGYDSDPDQVMAILREEAYANANVLRYPQPFIYFAGFGDSSLNFEIRAMIRDVNSMLSVKGALNLALLKRFREEGVEIPFPQRDLNLRNISGQSIAVATAPSANGHAEAAAPPHAASAPPAAAGDLAKPDLPDMPDKN